MPRRNSGLRVASSSMFSQSPRDTMPSARLASMSRRTKR
jgi:hypothetical protein